MVLDDKGLYTFKKEEESPTEVIDLSLYSQCVSDKDCGFNLISTENAPQFHFRAKNRSDHDAWIAMINKTIDCLMKIKENEEKNDNDNDNKTDNNMNATNTTDETDTKIEEREEENLVVVVETSMGGADWQHKICMKNNNVSVEDLIKFAHDLQKLNGISDTSEELNKRKEFIDIFTDRGGLLDLFDRLEKMNDIKMDEILIIILILFCQSEEGLKQLLNENNKDNDLNVPKQLLDKLFQTEYEQIKYLLLQFGIILLEKTILTPNCVANGMCHVYIY